MTSMTDLSQDLVEEILSRVSMTSLKALRSTCKLWNALSKDPSFINKHCGKAAKENLVIMIDAFKVCLMRVNLHGNHNLEDSVDPFIKQIGKLNHLVQISEVFQCNSLLLCVTREYDNSRLVVWNPYSGQIRLIQQPRNEYRSYQTYTMGYDNNNNHKILRIFCHFGHFGNEIYDLKSNSWKVLDVNIKPCIYRRSVSLTGNSYFIGMDAKALEKSLVCFDFTRETFRQFLPLPLFHYDFVNEISLTAVREEKVALLFKKHGAYEIKIWITNKIDQLNAVSWSNFFRLDLIPSKTFHGFYGCFFVDEKKKLVLFCDKYRISGTNHKAYMVGEGGYYGHVDLGESECQTLMCSSYVPTSVQIQ